MLAGCVGRLEAGRCLGLGKGLGQGLVQGVVAAPGQELDLPVWREEPLAVAILGLALADERPGGEAQFEAKPGVDVAIVRGAGLARQQDQPQRKRHHNGAS